MGDVELADGALGLAPQAQRQARETGTATPACRELPYPAPSLSSMSTPPCGRKARGSARRATIAAHGMTTPVRTNGDAPPAPPACGPGKERAARTHRKLGCPRAASRRRNNARSSPPSSIALSSARPICGDGVGSAPAFSGQKPGNICHCATNMLSRVALHATLAAKFRSEFDDLCT